MERSRLLRLLIGLGCLGAMAWTVAALGPRRVAATAAGADPVWLGFSVVPLVGRYLVWGYKWLRILRRRLPARYRDALRILIAGSFVNLTTPTAKLAGGVLRAVLLRRHYGLSLSSAYGRAFADQATSVLGSLALFGGLALTMVWLAPGHALIEPLSIAGGLILAGLAAGLALRPWAWRQLGRPASRRLLERLTPRWLTAERKEPPADTFSEDDPTSSVAGNVLFPLLGEGAALRTIVPDMAWAAASFACVCLASAMALRALGVQTDLWVLAVMAVLGYFAGSLVGVWGGIGVTEAALTALYVQAGVPPEIATAGTLLHRAAFYLVVLTWGGLSLYREGYK